MIWRGVAVGLVLVMMGVWTLGPLGFRELWRDVACGGPACDPMRAEAAAGSDLLVLAWVVGMVVGAAPLLVLARYRRTAGPL